jgi:hypothetical protein
VATHPQQDEMEANLQEVEEAKEENLEVDPPEEVNPHEVEVTLRT